MNAQEAQAAIVAAVQGINAEQEFLQCLGPADRADHAINSLSRLCTHAKNLHQASARLYVLLGATQQKMQREQERMQRGRRGEIRGDRR